MTDRTSIKMTHAALDEEGTEILLRGLIDASSLRALNVAEYQREILPDRTIGKLMSALQIGGIPDIQLGCRGGNFRQGDDSTFYIQDPVYIIDGLQRCTAAIRLMDKGIVPRLGATITFNTTEEMERKRFRVLNVTRVRLSPNVLLRNLRHESQSVQALNQMCSSSQFVLYRRVCWQQRMKREELITAMMLMYSIGNLHSRFGVGLTERSIPRVVRGLDILYDKIGRATFMGNARAFFAALDNAYNIKDTVYRDASVVMRSGFLLAISRVFAIHQDFWRDAEFSVPTELQRKLSTFPLSDPAVHGFATSSGKGILVLSNLMIDHLNSGKRTKRLRLFNLPSPIIPDNEEEDDHAAA